MTWNEFVKEVERQLEEQGLSGDNKLWYIDISWDYDVDDDQVVYDANNDGLRI